MKDNKQSSVEFLLENLHLQHSTKWDELVEQAKKMEEEQITDAHIEGQRVFDEYPHTQWTNDQAELYYNKTFNNKEK